VIGSIFCQTTVQGLYSHLISHLSSLISHLSSLISHLSSLISHLSSLISHLPSFPPSLLLSFSSNLILFHRTSSDIPEGTCFLDAPAESGTSPTFNLRDWVYDRLGIKENKPKKPRLGYRFLSFPFLSPFALTCLSFRLIMRRNKRFLLNLPELIEEAKGMGVEIVVLPLEDMTLFEQISALSSINILMGIHGSGLTNIRFIPSGGVLVQLHPWLVRDTNAIVQSFYRMAQENDCDFFCWQNKERANTRIHTHFLGKEFIGKEEEALEKELQNTAGDLWLRFWINQDTHFPPQEFRQVLQKAIERIRYDIH
jgi:hypothetical protein